MRGTLKRLVDDLKSHPVSVDIPDDLPIVRLDYGLMEQALYNILQNFAFHTPENTRAMIKAIFRDGILDIVISDNGPGFKEEDRLRAFEKFYRSANARSGGLGLGLSIARGFIQAHGGDITIENNIPGGARLTLRLPVFVSNLNEENES